MSSYTIHVVLERIGTGSLRNITKKEAYTRLDRMMKEDVINKEAANKKAERKNAK